MQSLYYLLFMIILNIVKQKLTFFDKYKNNEQFSQFFNFLAFSKVLGSCHFVSVAALAFAS